MRRDPSRNVVFVDCGKETACGAAWVGSPVLTFAPRPFAGRRTEADRLRHRHHRSGHCRLDRGAGRRPQGRPNHRPTRTAPHPGCRIPGRNRRGAFRRRQGHRSRVDRHRRRRPAANQNPISTCARSSGTTPHWANPAHVWNPTCPRQHRPRLRGSRRPRLRDRGRSAHLQDRHPNRVAPATQWLLTELIMEPTTLPWLRPPSSPLRWSLAAPPSARWQLRSLRVSTTVLVKLVADRRQRDRRAVRPRGRNHRQCASHA